MQNFSFTLQVAGINIERKGFEDAFYGKSCDDALIAVVDGTLFMDFDREAESYEGAVQSAIHDIQQAGGKVVRIQQIDMPLGEPPPPNGKLWWPWGGPPRPDELPKPKPWWRRWTS